MTSVNRFRLALVGLAFIVTAPVWAGEPAYDLEIESQPLAKALKAFAEQSGLQVVYYSELADGEESPEVSGTMTADQAMTQLLASTDLTFDTMGEDTVVVETVAIGVADERGASDPKNLNPQPVLMAQNQTSQRTQTTTSDRSDSEAEEAPTEDDRDTRGQIETIVVVGSRNAGIRRYEDDAQPYVVFDTIQLTDSFAQNVEEFLKTRLPMNAVQGTTAQQFSSVFGNQSTIDLRGLGSNQTLILVNGRRLPSVGATGALGQPDINGIPLSAIDRIEVLPSTASGIYGGGATGGAVNVILKRNYSGFDLLARYDDAFDSDVGQKRIEGSIGASLENGRTSFLLTGSYSDSNDLLAMDRDFHTLSREFVFRNNPSTIFDSFSPIHGFTTNIRNVSGANLVLDDGTDLGSSVTYVPIGYAGPQSDLGAALVANAGQYNLDLANDLGGGRAAILSAPTTRSASISVRREFTGRLDLFADFLYYGNESVANRGITLRTATLAADAPNNPFDSAIRVTYPSPYSDVELPRTSESTTIQAVLGATLELTENWSVQAEYTRNKSSLEASFYSPTTTLDYFFDVADGTLDVLRDLNEFPLDISSYLFDSPTEYTGPTDVELTTTSVRLTGLLVADRAAGPIRLSALIEGRSEEQLGSYQDVTSSTGVPSIRFISPREQEVDSFYVETILPLFGGEQASSGMGDLELQLAGRHDRYETTSQLEFEVPIVDSRSEVPNVPTQSTKVSSTDFTAGLRYAPADFVVFRASYGTGFLPPSVSQIFPISQTIPNAGNFLIDPLRGGVPGTNTLPIEIVGLGNPDLEPEESESISVGLIITPAISNHLRVSIDYTKIEKSNEIATALNINNIFEFESAFPGRVIRNPITPEDEALGYQAGEVARLDLTSLNVAKSNVAAYDFQVDYRLELGSFGRLDTYLVATYQTTLDSQILPTIERVDRVGFSDGPLRWRGNFGANLELDEMTFGWNAQYFDSYRVYTSTDIESFRERKMLDQGSEYVSSQIYHDIFSRIQLGSMLGSRSRALEGLELYVGIQNVFDKRPPILATIGSNVYSQYGDPRMRRFSVQLRSSF